MKQWTEYTKQELLNLPRRDWMCASTYKFVLIFPTRQKHDSGYNYFGVVGVKHNGEMELVGQCDDFRYNMFAGIALCGNAFSFDCSMKGVFRLWSNHYDIKVGHNLSTTEFEFIAKEA